MPSLCSLPQARTGPEPSTNGDPGTGQQQRKPVQDHRDVVTIRIIGLPSPAGQVQIRTCVSAHVAVLQEGLAHSVVEASSVNLCTHALALLLLVTAAAAASVTAAGMGVMTGRGPWAARENRR